MSDISYEGRLNCQIVKFPIQQRRMLECILYDSFDGLYLRHALRKLYQVEEVFVALDTNTPIGIAMLEELSKEVSYIFYIAVKRSYRRRGVASQLLSFCISYSASNGKKEIYAAVESDNEPSIRLFESKGFAKISFSEFRKKYGLKKAIDMYRRMVVVPGELLLVRNL